MLILAVMHIGKGQNMFYIWFDDKHIPLFHLSFIVGCAQINNKIFSKFFTTTNAISGDNTENVSEYNDEPVRESVELNSDKKEILHAYIQSVVPILILR